MIEMGASACPGHYPARTSIRSNAKLERTENLCKLPQGFVVLYVTHLWAMDNLARRPTSIQFSGADIIDFGFAMAALCFLTFFPQFVLIT